MSQEILDYVIADNAKTRKFMEENPQWHCSMWSEELSHYEDYASLDEWLRSMAIEAYINAYKSYHGIKPRWETFTIETNEYQEDGRMVVREMTLAEIEQMTDVLCKTEEQYLEEEEALQKAAKIAKAKERGAIKRACHPRLGDVFGALFNKETA